VPKNSGVSREIASVAVTGAGGFIAARVLHALTGAGLRCHAVTRRASAGLAARLPARTEIHEVGDYAVDQLESLFDSVRPDAIVNLASYGVSPADRDPGLILDGNVGMITRLLNAVAGRPPRLFVHAGSCFEYGPASGSGQLNEARPVDPQSAYGAAKAASVRAAHELGRQMRVPVVTLRLFGVYGPGEPKQRLIPYLLDRLRAGQPAELTAGEQVRDLLHVDDVAAAFLSALRSDRLERYRAYNIASGMPVTVREIGHLVAAVLGRPAELLRWGARPGRTDEAESLVGDSTAFREATGWRPTRRLAEELVQLCAELPGQRTAA
jgi:UDP-glucose 4-epimerase